MPIPSFAEVVEAVGRERDSNKEVRFEMEWTGGSELRSTFRFERNDERVAANRGKGKPAPPTERGEKCTNGYGFEGIAPLCPACNGVWLLIGQSQGSDGFAGKESGFWQCSQCSLTKSESYEGYGTIFHG